MESFASRSSLSEDVHPIISTILKYPTVQRNAKPVRKKLELPKHMTGEEALNILKLQEEEKRRIELVKEAKRQKKICSKTKQASRSTKRKKENVIQSDLESNNEEVASTCKSSRQPSHMKYRDEVSNGEVSEIESTSDDSNYEEKDNICGDCQIRLL